MAEIASNYAHSESHIASKVWVKILRSESLRLTRTLKAKVHKKCLGHLGWHDCQTKRLTKINFTDQFHHYFTRGFFVRKFRATFFLCLKYRLNFFFTNANKMLVKLTTSRMAQNAQIVFKVEMAMSTVLSSFSASTLKLV